MKTITFEPCGCEYEADGPAIDSNGKRLSNGDHIVILSDGRVFKDDDGETEKAAGFIIFCTEPWK